MERLIEIGGYKVDIDEKTSIGITFQAFDISEPQNRNVNVSNSFTIPKTSWNEKIFGFPDNPVSTYSTIYQTLVINYWVDNYQLIKNGKCYINSVGERIELIATQTPNFIETMKLITIGDFTENIVHSAIGTISENYAGYSGSSEFQLRGFYNNVISQFVYQNLSGLNNGVPLVMLPSYIKEKDVIDGDLHITLRDETNVDKLNSDNLYISIPYFFRLFCQTYGFNKLKIYNGEEDDSRETWGITSMNQFYRAYMPFQQWQLKLYNYNSPECTVRLESNMTNDTKAAYSESYIFDLFKAILNQFCAYVEYDDSNEPIFIRRFDDISLTENIKDWSGLAANSDITMKPSFGKVAQNSGIVFKNIGNAIVPKTVNMYIESENKNLDTYSELVSIDLSVPNVVNVSGINYLDLSGRNELTSNFFIVYIDLTIQGGHQFRYVDDVALGLTPAEFTTTTQLLQPYIMKPEGNYQLFKAMCQKPKMFTIKKWLSLKQLMEFKPFNLYTFKELGGSYYVNKISGWNDKSLQPTTLEVIKVTDYEVQEIEEIDYYSDGLGNPFTDGQQNKFF